MTKNWLPLNFLVWGKNYIFLETLEDYKKSEHSVQFLGDILWTFYGQLNINFSKLSHYMSNERVFSSAQFLLKDFITVYCIYDSITEKPNFNLSSVCGTLVLKLRNEKWLRQNLWSVKTKIINCIFQTLFQWYKTFKYVLIYILLWIVRTIGTLIAWE